MADSTRAAFLDTFAADPYTTGVPWERVCQWFLQTDPVYRAQRKTVWRWDDWPGVGSVRGALGRGLCS